MMFYVWMILIFAAVLVVGFLIGMGIDWLKDALARWDEARRYPTEHDDGSEDFR